jgi:hypothetical protein
MVYWRVPRGRGQGESWLSKAGGRSHEIGREIQKFNLC